MACALHPRPHPSVNYFYIGCQPRKCMSLDAHCQPVTSQPSSLPPLPYCWSLYSPRPESVLSLSKMAHEMVCAAGTRGPPFLSLTETAQPAPWVSPTIVLGFSRAALHWAAVRVVRWPAHLREKTDVPINFCQNVITSGLENHMGVGRDRNRCITFKYAITILQKFK